MSRPVRTDLYGGYRQFGDRILAEVRRETFGEDIGQNSWTTADEYRHFIELLGIHPDSEVLEIASGSGGPALFLARETGCAIVGIDIDPHAVATAERAAAEVGPTGRAKFWQADADGPLPFSADSFDALLCVDAANHLPRRLDVLRDWRRVLRPGALALWTDPVVITGPLTNAELAVRASIGVFLFAPEGANERLIGEAGFELVEREDLTERAARIAERWADARARHGEDLRELEGEPRFEALQRFFRMVHTLAAERRLSRIAYLMRRPADAAPRPLDNDGGSPTRQHAGLAAD